jgi:hypothetical protein
MKFHLFIILVLCCFINISAQLIPNPTAGKTAEAEAAEAKINKITKEAGIYFKQGLLGLQDDRRPQARADFDKSIEVFLLSGVNIRSNAKLQGCYSQLIETVYRIHLDKFRKSEI